MDKLRIMVVDDDPSILRLLCANLKARDYEVITNMDGEEVLAAIEKEPVDLVILDIMMPKVDGIEVCRRIRDWSDVPIIILSACGHENEKVRCLELGADDYMTKPFSVRELMARVKTALRHAQASKIAPTSPVFVCGDLEINFAARRVTLAGNEVRLTPTEYSLLQQLATSADKVLTHQMLLQRVWGEEYATEKEYLRVFVGRLRKKIENDPENPRYVMTVPGVGYQFSSSSNMKTPESQLVAR